VRAKTEHRVGNSRGRSHNRGVAEAELKGLRRALVVEDSTSLRVLLASALEAAGFTVTVAASPSKAIRLFGRADPDVLIADIDLGERPNGVELATILRAQAPYLGIVFLTNYTSAKAFERTIAPPPRYGFLQKDMLDSTDRLVAVVESVLDDAESPQRISADVDDNPLNALTAQQLDVVRMMATGMTNSQIAEARSTSLRAAERLVTRIFDALRFDDEKHGNPRVLAVNLYTRTFGYPAGGEVL
jgi:DNA-binding NarL/FixJ family response regulator